MKSSKFLSYGVVFFAIGAILSIPHDSSFGVNFAFATELELTHAGQTTIDLNDPEMDRIICTYAEFTDFQLSDGSFDMKIINQQTAEIIYDSSISVGSTKSGLADFNSAVVYIVTESMIANNEVIGGDYFIEVSTADGSVSKNLPFTMLSLVTPPTSNGGGTSYAVPSINQATFTSLGNPDAGFGGIIQDVNLNSLETTQILNTGDDALIRVGLSDSDGISDVEHITIYLNYNGDRGIIPFNSIDTSITYQKGQPLKINDPNGLINSASINLIPVDATNFVVNLEINFANSMDTSNIAIRSWDLARNEVSIEFANAIQVINPNSKSIDGVSNSSISNWVSTSFDWWSQGLISDTEFFETIDFLVINGLVKSDYNTLISNLIANS